MAAAAAKDDRATAADYFCGRAKVMESRLHAHSDGELSTMGANHGRQPGRRSDCHAAQFTNPTPLSMMVPMNAKFLSNPIAAIWHRVRRKLYPGKVFK
ncbi:MAG: hypothetical protein WCK65_12605 [Rhodospirillaceae bacterium]